MAEEPKVGPNRGNAGKGRPKGSSNKTTAALKDMILKALDEADPKGSVAYLKKQAEDNPTAFLTLVGKVLPLQVNAEVEAGKRLAKIVREFVSPPHSNG
jgi:hypothetical protein